MTTQEKQRTLEYLDRAKEALGIQSDYALAKALKVSQPAIMNYRAGRNTMDDEVAVKVANILKIDPVEVMAAAHLDRAKSDETRDAWKRLLDKISKGFDVLLPYADPRGDLISA